MSQITLLMPIETQEEGKKPDIDCQLVTCYLQQTLKNCMA